MYFVLVRHGETTWNADERLQGRADAPLSDAGRAQVRELAPGLAGFDRVVRSPLSRAGETATLLGYPHAVVDDRWTELDLGEWTTIGVSELPDDDVARWRSGAFVPPGGEHFEDAVERVRTAIAEAAVDGSAPVLVITHGGAIRAAVTSVTGVARAQLAPVAPASVTVLDTVAGAIVAYGAPSSVVRVLAGRVSHAL